VYIGKNKSSPCASPFEPRRAFFIALFQTLFTVFRLSFRYPDFSGIFPVVFPISRFSGSFRFFFQISRFFRIIPVFSVFSLQLYPSFTEKTGQRIGYSGGHTPEDGFISLSGDSVRIKRNCMVLVSPMVIRPPRNIFIREIVREMAFKGYFVDIGVMLQDPFQGNSEDAFNLVLGPCPFIIIQNTDKGIKSDHTGAGGLFQFSDDLDLVPVDEQFLRRFAHGSFQRKLSGLDPPAGKTDLTGLSVELCCAYFI
jgi:hypothetical protein